MRALLVDDSRAVRSIVRRILAELDFDVVEAENGKVALETLREGEFFDIALVDVNMPEMNGIDLVRCARADDQNNATRIIMVTTESETDRIQQAIDAGADEYITKPFTKDVIRETLAIAGIC